MRSKHDHTYRAPCYPASVHSSPVDDLCCACIACLSIDDDSNLLVFTRSSSSPLPLLQRAAARQVVMAEGDRIAALRVRVAGHPEPILADGDIFLLSCGVRPATELAKACRTTTIATLPLFLCLSVASSLHLHLSAPR